MATKEMYANIYDQFDNGWGEIPPPNVPVRTIVSDNGIKVNGNLIECVRGSKFRLHMNDIRRKGKYVGLSNTPKGIVFTVAPDINSLGTVTISFKPIRPRAAK